MNGAAVKDGEEAAAKASIRRYQHRDLISIDVLEGPKDKLRFFRDQQIVELKQIKTGMQVSIYDFANRLTVYCQSFPQVLFVEVEDDAVYVLAATGVKGGQMQKQLHKLYEMEDNVKIQTLLKKGLFPEAQDIARAANFPGEIIAEISKEHADNLYEKKLYDEALKQFIKTIGYLNPSYVIQRYIEVPQLPNLIAYLEHLIDSPSSQRHQANLNSLADYNKDYTALLLNCYVKTKKPEKISHLIEKASSSSSNSSSSSSKDTIFDVATAIEVCRQQEDTLEQAEQLALKSKQWGLLVQIKVENRKEPAKALEIIDKQIANVKEKVECLQLYAPKLFKAIVAAKSQEWQVASRSDLKAITLIEQLQGLVRNIVGALVEFKKQKKFTSDGYKHYELKEKQKVRIEDLI